MMKHILIAAGLILAASSVLAAASDNDTATINATINATTATTDTDSNSTSNTSSSDTVGGGCRLDQFEIDFNIQSIGDSIYSEGFGRLQYDRRVANLTAMNLTLTGVNSTTDSVLYVSDWATNLAYSLDLTSGLCSAKASNAAAECSACEYSYTGTVQLGAATDSDKLAVGIFNAVSGELKNVCIALMVTRNECPPIYIKFPSVADGKFMVTNVFNASLGISSPGLLRIPEGCRRM